jgi:hypothetical protein
MSQLTQTVAKAQGEHRQALQWFAENAGKTISWSVIKAQADNGFRLVNQAKGIYKPHYTEYALSVRQTLDGPYADKDVEWRPDGSWVYPYFQENPDPAQRNREATNRGLMQCMEDSVPIGVLLQTSLSRVSSTTCSGLLWSATGGMDISSLRVSQIPGRRAEGTQTLTMIGRQPRPCNSPTFRWTV